MMILGVLLRFEFSSNSLALATSFKSFLKVLRLLLVLLSFSDVFFETFKSSFSSSLRLVDVSRASKLSSLIFSAIGVDLIGVFRSVLLSSLSADLTSLESFGVCKFLDGVFLPGVLKIAFNTDIFFSSWKLEAIEDSESLEVTMELLLRLITEFARVLTSKRFPGIDEFFKEHLLLALPSVDDSYSLFVDSLYSDKDTSVKEPNISFVEFSRDFGGFLDLIDLGQSLIGDMLKDCLVEFPNS